MSRYWTPRNQERCEAAAVALEQLFEEYPTHAPKEKADRRWIIEDLLHRGLYTTAMVAARRAGVPPSLVAGLDSLLS